MTRYLWCGDGAVTIELGEGIDPQVLERVRAFAQAVEHDPPPGFIELIPAYRSVTVEVDPLHPDAERVEAALRQAEARSSTMAPTLGRRHVMPVHYGAEDGPDLEDVARSHGLSPEQVVALHGNREYLVYCVGFSPGFAYLGGLPEELHTPRLGTPRKLVPAGSVGIGGQQTGVYPVATPGGWRLVGRTSFTLFDVQAEPPCPLRPGDRVVFQAVDELPPGSNTRMAIESQSTGRPALDVLKPGLFTTVQDLGRRGYQAAGVSVAGAMDALALRLANRAAGNDPGAAALEITLLGPVLRVLEPCRAAISGAELDARLNGQAVALGAALELEPGDMLDLGRAVRGARAYFAVAGGIDTAPVLGSRSTYTRAGFGGVHGRALRAGDKLATGPAPGDLPAGRTSLARPPLPQGNTARIRVVLGPQDDHFSAAEIERFLSSEFPISPDADRMGYRLAGPVLSHLGPAEIVSDGVVLGSIQVPPHGHPIIMLADRPSIGGYPKIATVISADVRLVAQCRPGDTLRFEAVSVEEAREALIEQQRQYWETSPGRGWPVDRVRGLIAGMERSGTQSLELSEAGTRFWLARRGQPSKH